MWRFVALLSCATGFHAHQSDERAQAIVGFDGEVDVSIVRPPLSPAEGDGAAQPVPMRRTDEDDDAEDEHMHFEDDPIGTSLASPGAGEQKLDPKATHEEILEAAKLALQASVVSLPAVAVAPAVPTPPVQVAAPAGAETPPVAGAPPVRFALEDEKLSESDPWTIEEELKVAADLQAQPAPHLSPVAQIGQDVKAQVLGDAGGVFLGFFIPFVILGLVLLFVWCAWPEIKKRQQDKARSESNMSEVVAPSRTHLDLGATDASSSDAALDVPPPPKPFHEEFQQTPAPAVAAVPSFKARKTLEAIQAQKPLMPLQPKDTSGVATTGDSGDASDDSKQAESEDDDFDTMQKVLTKSEYQQVLDDEEYPEVLYKMLGVKKQRVLEEPTFLQSDGVLVELPLEASDIAFLKYYNALRYPITAVAKVRKAPPEMLTSLQIAEQRRSYRFGAPFARECAPAKDDGLAFKARKNMIALQTQKALMQDTSGVGEDDDSKAAALADGDFVLTRKVLTKSEYQQVLDDEEYPVVLFKILDVKKQRVLEQPTFLQHDGVLVELPLEASSIEFLKYYKALTHPITAVVKLRKPPPEMLTSLQIAQKKLAAQ